MRCPHCGAPNSDDARFCGACGRATSATEPSRAGVSSSASAPDLTGREIAGRYRILAKLGEGGMGAVYRGEQISLKRKCAIKLLKPELSSDAGLVKRFNAEAELVAKLSHPNVVNIYDFGQDQDGTLFIAMEFIEGRSLRSAMIADGPLPVRRAVAIAAQVAASLTDAHAHGIVHRDLKPDNVMLTERGREKDVVRVLDFGIAKLRDENKQTVQAMTQAGDLVGTPQYMAPEQIRGDRIDGRTDVYALGAMLYEMVTGRLPFEGPTVMAILSKHLTETPPPPSVRRPDKGIPPPVDALVMASLAKDPAQRIASMELVGEQLAAIGAQLGSPSQPFVVPSGPAPGPSGWQPGMPTQQSAAPVGVQVHATPHTPYPILAPPQVAPHLPTGTPPPMQVAPPAPVARRSKRGLWIGLALGAAAVIGAIAIVASQAGSSSSKNGGGSSSGTDAPAHDPWDRSGSSASDDTPPPSSQLAGVRYDDRAGWSLIVPPGFGQPQSSMLNGSAVTGFKSTAGGVESGIAVIAIPGMSTSMSDDELMTAARDFAKQINGTLFMFDFAELRGARRIRAIYDVQEARVQAVLYLGSPTSLVVMFGTERSRFDDTEPLRKELFDQRIILP